MKRLLHTLDLLLGLTLATSLVMCVLTAWPTGSLAAGAAQPAGEAAGQQRTLAPFDAIRIAGGFELRVLQGEREALLIHADAAQMPRIETSVDGSGTLHIGWTPGTAPWQRGKPRLELTVVRLQRLASAGANRIRIEALTTPQLNLAESGSGQLQLIDLSTDALELHLSGSASASASGRAKRLQARIAGSGEIDAAALVSEEVAVSIAGSGNAALQAQKTLSVSIAGSGDVVDSGPATVQTSVAGSGRVRRR